jgi:hypothetical protein
MGAIVFAGTYALSLMEGWKMHIGAAFGGAAVVAVVAAYQFSRKEAP